MSCGQRDSPDKFPKAQRCSMQSAKGIAFIKGDVMKMARQSFSVIYLSMMLAACGGGSSSSSGGGSPSSGGSSTSFNVALPANGATVAATYGGTTANFVTDGDTTTTTNFWTGNVADDAVTVDFGKSRLITNVTLYTNDTAFNSANITKYVEVSTDKVTWKKTMQPVGADISCLNYKIGAASISCDFSTAQFFRYIRVRVTAVSPSAEHVVELQVTGN